MSYQVLARKWRPHDFSSMVGQVHVVRALANALDAMPAGGHINVGIQDAGAGEIQVVFSCV